MTTFPVDFTSLKSVYDDDTAKDAHDQAHRLMIHAAKMNYPREQVNAIRSYTGNVSPFLNAQLIEHKGDLSKAGTNIFFDLDKMREDDRHLHAAFDHHTGLPEEVHIASGIGRKFAEHLNTLKPGAEIESHAWLSWSIDPYVAHGRGNGPAVNGTHQRHIITCTLPAGSKHGIYVGGMSSYISEKEVTTRRGLKFRLVSTKTSPLGPSGGVEGMGPSHAATYHHHLEVVD